MGPGRWYMSLKIITLRPGQNGRRFADDTFKRIFLNENVDISNEISLKFVPKGPINNNPALVQIMAWRLSTYYLNLWWLVYRRIYASLGLNELRWQPHLRCGCYLKWVIFKLISRVDIFEHFLWNCPEVYTTRSHWWLVNIGSDNGLVSSSNKPLPEPIFAKFYRTIWHHYATMS